MKGRTMEETNCTESPLYKAIEAKNQAVVNFLITAGYPATPADLYRAVEVDFAEGLRLLLSERGELCSRAEETMGRSPLHEVRSLEIAEMLLEAGFKPDQPNRLGELPHETVQDREIALLLQRKYEELHPAALALPIVKPAELAWDQRFTAEVVELNDLVPVDCNAATGSFAIEFNGERFQTTSRFLTSLARKLKFSNNIFNYFSGEEVFSRIYERAPDVSFRVTFDNEQKKVLGVVDQTKKILPPQIACKIFADDPKVIDVQYEDGVWKAELDIDQYFIIKNDSEYRRKFFLHYPVDGINMPAIYLAVERQICANGATAFVNQFKTEIEINDQSGTHLSRLLRSFSNESGFLALESRIAKAQETFASVAELLRIENLINTQINDREVVSQLTNRLEEIAGDPCARYEITSLNNIPPKRRSLLPVDCSVNDLLNFCSELTTHHHNLINRKELFDVLFGTLLASEYDLEGLYHFNRQARPFYANDLHFANRKNEERRLLYA